jgi:hypothetical protein
MNLGELIQQLHHAVIIFEGVQTGPRQAIFTCNQILVKRLVLMPKKDNPQRGHGWTSQSSMGHFHPLQVRASGDHYKVGIVDHAQARLNDLGNSCQSGRRCLQP